MPSMFLKCSICPKQPSFSDASHLLTHISSKGHLAHLHKLQIRSHQEITAVQQLTTYNQWYQEHEVARLLSERLQQKEAKQATKNSNHKRKARAEILMNTNINHEASSKTPQSKKVKREALLDEPNNEISIVANFRGSKLTSIPLKAEILNTPVRRSTRLRSFLPLSSSLTRTGNTFGAISLADVDPTLLPPSTPPKPKGIQWPGMNMFDAAPSAMRRKRNQKKDVSVLNGLRRASSLVQPFETIQSANGIVLKYRHMDRLEDDSPVLGEPLLNKPYLIRRAQISSRTGTIIGRRQINARTFVMKQQSPLARKSNHLQTSFTTISTSASSDSPDMNDSPIPINFGKPKQDIKVQPFKVYEDATAQPGLEDPSQQMPNPFCEAHNASTTTPLSGWNIPIPDWLKTQHQQNQTYDPFKAFRTAPVSLYPHDSLAMVKTPLPLGQKSVNIQIGRTVNPLALKPSLDDMEFNPQHGWCVPFNGNSNHFDLGFGGHAEESYASQKNPLSNTLIQFHDLDEYLQS